MSEYRTVPKEMEWLREQGAFAEKHHGDGTERLGLHDICCCFEGVYVAIEYKRDEATWRAWLTAMDRRSVLQRRVLEEVRAARGVAFCTWRHEDVATAVYSIKLGCTPAEVNSKVDYQQQEFKVGRRSRVRSNAKVGGQA